jgi:hypothetical protein
MTKVELRNQNYDLMAGSFSNALSIALSRRQRFVGEK